MGADTKANTSGAAAHLRLVISVLLRMAASAVAPLTPISLPLRLRARDRMGHCERAGNGGKAGRDLWRRALSEGHLRLCTEVAAGSIRLSSPAEMTLMERPPRYKLTIASSSRSRCTGTPRTVPDAAQATAASSNSCGSSPSPWMQLRRAAPPRGASLSSSPSSSSPSSSPSSSSSSSSSASRFATRTACTSTTKPKPCSRARCGSWRLATTTSHGLSAFLRHSTSRSVMEAKPVGSGCPSRRHSRLHSSRRARVRHATLTALSWHKVAASAC
eukprot:scaffold54609_cov71-Phaeocystis_antarctica.AAC.2